MSIANEIKNLQSEIYLLLERDARLRDSDAKLCARIWTNQIGGLSRAKNISMYEFLCEYIDDSSSLLSQESIGRARRKIQEEHPHLRGELWEQRQRHQSDVITEIKNYES